MKALACPALFVAILTFVPLSLVYSQEKEETDTLVSLVENGSGPEQIKPRGIKKLCFRGHPKPDCDFFLITEIGYAFRMQEFSRPKLSSSNGCFNWELGLMGNVNARYALGGAFYLAAGEEGSRLGIKPRLRRWLAPDVSLDLSPGIILSGNLENNEDNIYADINGIGFVGSVDLNFSDLFSLTTQLEAVPYKGTHFRVMGEEIKKTAVSLYGGAKLGSGLGLVGTSVILGLAILVAATWN